MAGVAVLREPRERVIFGPDLIQDAEAKVRIIRANLRAAQDR